MIKLCVWRHLFVFILYYDVIYIKTTFKRTESIWRTIAPSIQRHIIVDLTTHITLFVQMVRTCSVMNILNALEKTVYALLHSWCSNVSFFHFPMSIADAMMKLTHAI